MIAKAYSDQKNWSNTYLTDPKLIELLGPFVIDPCCPKDMPWKTASHMFTEDDNGLSQDWLGTRVFMNPPYRGVLAWAKKFTENCNGIALLNGRSTETKATQIIMRNSLCIWFPKGRLSFYKITGEPFEQKWFPSLLIGMKNYDYTSIKKAQSVYGGEIFFRGE